MIRAVPASIDDTQTQLSQTGYVADRALATVVYLALKMGRPLLLEGEAGVGKTEIAKSLATMLGRKLIRMQCYEGLDVASAVYEWNYAGQMMAIRLAEVEGSTDRARLESDLFSSRFLIKRPLLSFSASSSPIVDWPVVPGSAAFSAAICQNASGAHRFALAAASAVARVEVRATVFCAAFSAR